MLRQGAKRGVTRKPRDDPEHRNQVWLFQWVAANLRKYPDLECLYAIPNGGQRNKAVAAKLKAEGVKSGVSDLHLPVARGGFCGLWIELKIEPNKPTKAQIQWLESMRAQGHDVDACYGWNESRQRIEDYLKLPRTKLGETE